MKEFTKEHSLIAKGIAIMLLLFYHLFHDEYVLNDMQVNYAPLSKQGILTLSGFGNICVAVFVMITAYGIAHSILKDDSMTLKQIGANSVKRFWKLIRNFFIVYVSVNLICFSFFNYASLYGEGKQGILFMLCDATGLSPVLKTPMLNETWWYMKVAYVLIFLVPLMTICVKKMGNSMLLFSLFAPFIVNLDKDIERYFFVAAFGVCAAYGNWFSRVINLQIHTIFKWGFGIVGSILSVLIRQNAVVKDYFWNYVDAPIAFFIICTVVMTLGSVPIVTKMLEFIGKHSMNIFLMHTFLYLIVFRNYVYYFKYAIVTFLILLVASLLFSVVLELIKKYVTIFLKKLKKNSN